jgi:hypothetical protein
MFSQQTINRFIFAEFGITQAQAREIQSFGG